MAIQSSLTVADVAALLQCSEKKVRRLAARGALGSYRLGRDWRFEEGDLERFKNRNRHPPAPVATNKDERAPRRRSSQLKGWNKFT